MKHLGKSASPMPQVRPGDFERALALLASVTDLEATKVAIKGLWAATEASRTAREEASAAAAEAQRQRGLAGEAQAAATLARQALVDETAAHQEELGRRELNLAEREKAIGAAERSQALRDSELNRREDHLRKAGVRGF